MQLGIMLIQQNGGNIFSYTSVNYQHWRVDQVDNTRYNFSPIEQSFLPARHLLFMPYMEYHYCIVTVTLVNVLSHRSLLHRKINCFLPLIACIVLFVGMEYRFQGKGFHVKSNLNNPSSVCQVYNVFISNKDLLSASEETNGNSNSLHCLQCCLEYADQPFER